MKFQPHFLRIATLPMVSLLSIIAVAALRPVYATELQAESDAERYVLEQLHKGEGANLNSKFPPNSFPEEMRKLRGSFVAALLTNREAHLKSYPHGVSITGTVITGELELIDEEIPYDVTMYGCTFDGHVDFTNSHFAKRLKLVSVKFNEVVDFSGVTIGFDFTATNCRFVGGASFERMRVGRDFDVGFSKFDDTVSFHSAQVGGAFDARGCTFVSHRVSFGEMRVEGRFNAYGCTFTDGEVFFTGADFTDVFLNNVTFERVSTVDFRRMHAEIIYFDDINFTTPSEVKLDQLTFKVLSPVDPDKLHFLLSRYDAEFYSNLETSFRTRGYADEADKIFIAKKRAERRENCKDFLGSCNRGVFAWSLFQDMLAGYGKRLQYLLGWSFVFLIIGMFVFRSEKGMRTKDSKDAPYYAGRYQPFWYSLDLFLPIIKLGEAEVWTPKDNRRWALLYRKLHIIIGSLFVPIGLAAWTGIIK